MRRPQIESFAVRWMVRSAILVLLPFAAACTHLGLEDCPTHKVFGEDVPRIRSSHYRMALADLAAAAARFLPYAAMSAYAYRDGPDCNPPGKNPVPDDAAAILVDILKKTSNTASEWKRAPELELKGDCEDDRGMMYNVWYREIDGRTDVVLAFRGTSTTNDWWYGNLWWFTRWILRDNQFTRARQHADAVIKHFQSMPHNAGKSVRFYTTGHSLGGSLAQHVLYAYPHDVLQAIVFDPSAVTAFDDLSPEHQLAGCSCGDVPAPETRMMRVYQSGEILVNLRIFHKIWFPPHRHIQEVRLPLLETHNPVAAHNMRAFTEKLGDATHGNFVFNPETKWYASSDAQCTVDFVEAQRRSCSVEANESNKCPQ